MCRGQLAHLETKTAALDESKDYEMALVVKELMQKNEVSCISKYLHSSVYLLRNLIQYKNKY